MENKTNEKENTALYIRVSTEEQANEGYGIDVQLETSKAFITLHNHTLHKDHIYKDEGFSGTLPIEERPGLQRLFNDAEAGKFQKVLVYKVDRLARDNFILIGCVRRLNELGINFCSATEPFDTSNIFGNFMVQFLGATAEMDRKNILERTRNGRIMAAKAGNWVMGTPPYGYKLVGEKKKVKVEINQKQAKWVKTFFEWLVLEKCSLKEVARRANDLKIPTKLQEENSKRKGQGIWWPRTLGRMFTNETYTGTIYFLKYKKAHKELKTLNNQEFMRDKKEWIPFQVPQIISQELFDQAVKQLKKNSQFAKRKKKKSYLFSGLLHCSQCGFKFRGGYHKPTSKTATGSKSYNGFTPKNRREHSKRCDYCGGIAETRLMSIWESLKIILTQPDLVYKKLKKYSGQNNTDSLSGKVDLIDRRLNSLKLGKERINKAYLDIGSIDEQEYKARLKENEQSQEEIQCEKRKLNDILISEKERNERIDLIGNLYKKLKKELDNPSYETMDKIIHIFINRVHLNLANETADVEFTFPYNTKTAFLKSNLNTGYPTNPFSWDVKILQDNPSAGCPAKPFSLYVQIPLISEKEIQKADNPRRSRYYKGPKVSPVKQLSLEKATTMQIIGAIN